MVFNTTAAEALDKNTPDRMHSAVFRQIAYGVFGLVCGLVTYRLGYKRILAFSPLLLVVVTLFLGLVLIPGLGMQINGARRWIEIGGFSLQPSEFAKILIPLFFVHAVQSKEGRFLLKDLLKILSVIAVPMVLILIEPDNGSVGIIFVCLMACLFLMRVRWVYWALPVLIMASVGVVAAINMPHVKSRIAVYLNPELDLRGKGHQPYQAKIAAGSGKIWGRGPGGSLQKHGFLPEARSDYIAAIFAEEFGFIGMLTMITALMCITSLGFKISRQSRSRQGFFVAAIMTFLLSFQAFLNLGVVSGLLPSKGLSLPFVSQGGSSLLAACITLSLILSVERGNAKI